MNATMHNQALDLLTGLVDRTSLQYVLSTLAEVASTKATSYSPGMPETERAWDKAAAQLMAASLRDTVKVISPARSLETAVVTCTHCRTTDRIQFTTLEDLAEVRCAECDRWFNATAGARR